MKFTITIDDSLTQTMVDALCDLGAYQPRILKDGQVVDNPVKKEDFAVSQVGKMLCGALAKYRTKLASQTAVEYTRGLKVEMKIGS